MNYPFAQSKDLMQAHIPKFYVFKKRATGFKLIYGTHLRIIQAIDHNNANRSLDQWNKMETENQTTNIWDPMTPETPGCDRNKYLLLFNGNTYFNNNSEIREAVFKAANDWDSDVCTEFPVTLEFFLVNGKTCGYTVYFEETRIGEFKERMEKLKKDKFIKEKVEQFRAENKDSMHKLSQKQGPPPYDQCVQMHINNNAQPPPYYDQSKPSDLSLRKQRMFLRLARKRALESESSSGA